MGNKEFKLRSLHRETYSEEAKRYVLKNHKTVPIQKLAETLNKSIKETKSLCQRMMCSYYSE